jgi:hypothetical protein
MQKYETKQFLPGEQRLKVKHNKERIVVMVNALIPEPARTSRNNDSVINDAFVIILTSPFHQADPLYIAACFNKH